ncbi:MAG: hypothetical protein WD898_04125 [Candidatus Paceibacterota bacterium]
MTKNNFESQKQGETKISVSFPDEIKLELVQANELRHYELFQWLVAILLPIAIGFWTAYFTTAKTNALVWSAGVFTVVAVLFVGMAVYHRRKVFHGSVAKSISLKDLK